MPRHVFVHSLPAFVGPDRFAGAAVVVIDVLRASTTIVHALEAGAREIVPCLEVDDARQFARSTPGDDVLLGGEREGLPIEGFDLGNSPDEYTRDRVVGKTIAFTTTNGTRAIRHARMAARLFIGAFVNAEAVVNRLLGEDEVHLLCAGTRGEVGEDDVLLAGLLVERFQRQTGDCAELNAQALTAREFWTHAFALPQAVGAEPLPAERLAARLRRSPAAKRLIALGLEADILAAAELDRFHGVPVVDPSSLRIRLP